MKKNESLLRRLAGAPVGVMFCVLAGLALVLNLLLETLGRHSLTDALRFLCGHPIYFLYNSLIIFFTLTVCLLAKRRMTTLLLLTTVWLALGVTNFIVLTYRSSPLSAIDFLVAKSAIGMFSIYLSIVQIILIALLIIAFLGLMIWLFVKCPLSCVYWKKSLLCIIATGITVLGASMFATETNAVEYESGELADAYGHYGFAYCFTRSLVSQGVEKPEDYEPERVVELIDSLDSEPDTTAPDESEPAPTEDAVPNIIFVQLESFYDVSNIQGLSFSEDPTPNFTALKENGVSGKLRVANVGGGTANTEFEVLTGMNLDHFGFGEYPYTTILQSRACESIASVLRELGCGTHAIHNHTATFYDRHIVYGNLGFDTFTPIEMMSGVKYNPLGWACDDVMTGEILSALDSTESSDFVFAVTVQGHGKYPSEPLDVDELEENSYLDDMEFDSDFIRVYGLDDESERSQYTYYVNQLNETNAFIGELIAELTERGEPCVVVFYGDHMPALALTDEDLVEGSLYETEYAVWTNTALFDGASGELDRDLEAYSLSAYVQQLCGISEGSITRLHQRALETGEDIDDDLRLLEYAQLYDENAPVMTSAPVTYGTRDVTITGWMLSGNTLYITGSGFNEYSIVRVDGFTRNTTLLSGNTLAVENVFFKVSDVEVIQYAEDGTELTQAVHTTPKQTPPPDSVTVPISPEE
ncbi:MAG: LTA synthase family protein [Clostridia bacterium]|nr:LTA synthase family protein [Clostridia bacterium]